MEWKKRGKPSKRIVSNLPYSIRGSQTDISGANTNPWVLREYKCFGRSSQFSVCQMQCKTRSSGNKYNGQTRMQFGKPRSHQSQNASNKPEKKNVANSDANNMPSLKKPKRVRFATSVIDLEEKFAEKHSTLTNQKKATVSKTGKISRGILLNANDSKQKKRINSQKATTGRVTNLAIPKITKAKYTGKTAPWRFYELPKDVSFPHCCSLASITDENTEQKTDEVEAMELYFDQISKDPQPWANEINSDESEMQRLAVYDDMFSVFSNEALERFDFDLNESRKPGTPASMDSEYWKDQAILDYMDSEDYQAGIPWKNTSSLEDTKSTRGDVKDQSEVHEERNLLSECKSDTSSDISDSSEASSTSLSSLVRKQEMDDTAYLEAHGMPLEGRPVPSAETMALIKAFVNAEPGSQFAFKHPTPSSSVPQAMDKYVMRLHHLLKKQNIKVLYKDKDSMAALNAKVKLRCAINRAKRLSIYYSNPDFSNQVYVSKRLQNLEKDQNKIQREPRTSRNGPKTSKDESSKIPERFQSAFDKVTKMTKKLPSTTNNIATTSKQSSYAPEKANFVPKKIPSPSEIIAKVLLESWSKPEAMAKTSKRSPVASKRINLTKKFPSTSEKMIKTTVHETIARDKMTKMPKSFLSTPEKTPSRSKQSPITHEETTKSSPIAHDKITKMPKSFLSTPEKTPSRSKQSPITHEETTKASELLPKTADEMIKTSNLSMSEPELINQLPGMVPMLLEQLPMMADSRVQKKMLKELKNYPKAVEVLEILQKLNSVRKEAKKASKNDSNITKKMPKTKTQSTLKVLPKALKDGPNKPKQMSNASVKCTDNYGMCMPKERCNKLKISQKRAKDLYAELNYSPNTSIEMLLPKVSRKARSFPKIFYVCQNGSMETKELPKLQESSKKMSTVTSKISNNGRKVPGVEPKTWKDRPHVPQQMPPKLKNNPNIPKKMIGTLKDEPSTSKTIPKMMMNRNAAKSAMLKGTETSNKGPKASKQNSSSFNHH